MADISKITLPSGTQYDIKDATARQAIEDLNNYTEYLGVTSTALTDGATTNPITINSQSVTAKNGNIVNYGSKEFIFNGTAWQEFGDLGGLGSLAYKSSATGTFTPSGTISTPSITITPSSEDIYSITGVGTMPTFSATVANENLTLGWTAGSSPTRASKSVLTEVSATSSQPSFTGTAGTVTVS